MLDEIKKWFLERDEVRAIVGDNIMTGSITSFPALQICRIDDGESPGQATLQLNGWIDGEKNKDQATTLRELLRNCVPVLQTTSFSNARLIRDNQVQHRNKLPGTNDWQHRHRVSMELVAQIPMEVE